MSQDERAAKTGKPYLSPPKTDMNQLGLAIAKVLGLLGIKTRYLTNNADHYEVTKVSDTVCQLRPTKRVNETGAFLITVEKVPEGP